MDRVRAELGNRFSLLLTHGMMGALGGGLILFFGLGTALAGLPGGRVGLGLLGLVAGSVTHFGTVFRRPALQLDGMALLACWYGAAAVGYVYVLVKAPGPFVSWPWEPSTNPVTPYPAILFGGLAVMAVRHVLTLSAIRRIDAEQYVRGV